MLTQHAFLKTILTGGAAIAIAACCHAPPPPPPPPPPPAPPPPMQAGQIDTDIDVSVTQDGAGKFVFRYDGNFIDAEGNLDFTQGGAEYNAVRIEFCLDQASVDNGVRFMPSGRKPNDGAMWIALADDLPQRGSPRGPYKGDQFVGLATIKGGKCAQVVDKNDDGNLYRYALRFQVPGINGPVAHDPDIRNGRLR